MNGEILKKLRIEANLTQSQLAEKLGIAPSTIRMIELGKRNGSKDVTDKIAGFFDVSLDFLNGRSEDRNINKEKHSKEKMIDEFLNTLIDDGIITNPNDIDDETATMILNAVKAQIAFKLKKRKKGDK